MSTETQLLREALYAVQKKMAEFIHLANHVGINDADGFYLAHAIEVEAQAHAALTHPALAQPQVAGEVAGWRATLPDRPAHLDLMPYTPGTPPSEVIEYHERLGRRIEYAYTTPPATQASNQVA